MAAKKEESAQTAQTPLPIEATTAPQGKTEKRPAGIHVGMIVHYNKASQMGFSNKVEQLAAIVVAICPVPDPSNFQEKDGAVDLHVFGTRSNEDAKRHGVMYAHPSCKPDGRWSFIPPRV